MISEIWKDIPGWEGHYQASNLGNIKSVGRKVWIPSSTRNVGYWRHIRERILKPCCTPSGYLSVALTVDHQLSQCSVHVLVAKAWLGLNGEGNLVVNHLNGIKTDNKVSNLEVTTMRGNVAHAIANGYIKTGFDHVNSVLTLEQAIEIAKIKFDTDKSNQAIAEMYGVSRTTIHRALRLVNKMMKAV